MVVDTSAWVEYLRATGSRADVALTQAVREGSSLAVPDIVRLELLAGAGSDQHVRELQRLLARFTALPAASPADHEVAAGCTGPHAAAVRRCGRCWTAWWPPPHSGRTPQCSRRPRLRGARRGERPSPGLTASAEEPFRRRRHEAGHAAGAAPSPSCRSLPLAWRP
jgi:hypothetical protein